MLFRYDFLELNFDLKFGIRFDFRAVKREIIFVKKFRNYLVKIITYIRI